MTTDILTEIIAHKRVEIAIQETAVPRMHLEKMLDDIHPCIRMSHALRTSSTGIIAEFKRRSPSKGWLHPDADAALTAGYEQAGAAALSILTDEKFFGGNLGDIRKARELTHLPILRKDFIISPYQLLQAKLVGADAVLLIAAVLTPAECRELARLAHELKLEVLLEIHDESELEHLNDDIDLLGVNNRHLGTFHTDTIRSFLLAERLPSHLPWVSESGIAHPETLRQLRKAGYQGFLIGETFMKTPQPHTTLANFIRSCL
ncbi:indole-3-glycerol phosphate synthase TrpC [Bacteroides sp. Marseille-P3684]|uniref:indole-3-glycerol phosphate synthase TrpC n=1 Tax=Bacteroides sp. Marseille-P3684 TaxID=2086579 RepID=UPI000D0B24F7|nr:indole-3-glycerol phosphate synthase TrpC [Bacteroides sp. Marseille-P3684]